MSGYHHRSLVTLLLISAVSTSIARGQAPGVPAISSTGDLAPVVASAAATAQRVNDPAPLVVANRFVVMFRATVLSRPPSARATAAKEMLARLAEELPGARTTTRAFPEAILVRLGDRPVFLLVAADVDALQGEDLAATAGEAARRLQVAFDEAVELRTMTAVTSAGAIALAATVLYVLAMWCVIKVDRRVAQHLSRSAERHLRRLGGGDALVQATGASTNVTRVFTLITWVLGLLLTYAWLTIVMRRFPYTRPWGESLRGGLFALVASVAQSVLDVLPNLLIVLLIVVVIRLLTRLATVIFTAVEQERLTLPGVYPDTALPTRRIVVALLWICALIVSYPYLPGSQSEVFKGVSVFVGLIVSLGSTGLMNQAMSGLMVTYSRSLKCGEYVRVGETEGTVTAVGALATKIRSPRNEEITIPNAVVASSSTTNFSRNLDEGVYSSTSVTIGYDTPWRQVHALLLAAATRTPGVRNEPRPVILQTALQDWYVQYSLFVALENPHRRFFTLDVLHANIQDAFNEHGVQIMSPRYVNDPAAPKIVPPDKWFVAPAVDGAGVPQRPTGAPRRQELSEV
jgi:small-conductance mechanosensitive channel